MMIAYDCTQKVISMNYSILMINGFNIKIYTYACNLASIITTLVVLNRFIVTSFDPFARNASTIPKYCIIPSIYSKSNNKHTQKYYQKCN